MIIKNAMKAQRFQVDQQGVDELKDEFFKQSHDFVYFRKGEWTGFEYSLATVISWIAENPEWVITPILMYPASRRLVQDIVKATGATTSLVKIFVDTLSGKRKNEELLRTVRVIVGEGRITKSEIKEWEDKCGKGSVVTIPKEQVGFFRFLVNEHRYAIFSRLTSDKLQGIMGKDKQTIRLLRYIFDREFIEASIRNRERKGK